MAKEKLKRIAVERKYRSVREAEEYTGLSAWFWRRQAYDGLVESFKVGTRLMIPISEIERVMAEGRRPRLAEPVSARNDEYRMPELHTA